jgi:hypothetical protein
MSRPDGYATAESGLNEYSFGELLIIGSDVGSNGGVSTKKGTGHPEAVPLFCSSHAYATPFGSAAKARQFCVTTW